MNIILLINLNELNYYKCGIIMKDKVVWDVHITLNSIFVALVSFPLVGVFIVLSYQLIQNAFSDPTVREDIESYIIKETL